MRYRYDPFGRRIAKTSMEGQSTKTTYYLYGANALMADVNEQGQMTKAYGFNPQAQQQGLWSTDPVWQAEVANGSLTDSQTRYHYLHTDHLATPMLATGGNGQTSWKAVSEAFGAAGILQDQSRIEMNLRLPGQYFDQETGAHYNFHRDYQPTMGRYLQADPIGLEGDINLFAYGENNPISAVDSQGLQAIVPTPIGPVPLPPPPIPPGGFPRPDFDPWRDTNPEIRIPGLDPRPPTGPGKPNDPEGGGACRRVLEACLQMSQSKMCPAPAKPVIVSICFATYVVCMASIGD